MVDIVRQPTPPGIPRTTLDASSAGPVEAAARTSKPTLSLTVRVVAGVAHVRILWRRRDGQWHARRINVPVARLAEARETIADRVRKERP